MENITGEENRTVVHEVAKVPVEVGRATAEDVETVGREIAKMVIEGATIVVYATKDAVSDIVKAGEQLGQDAKHALLPHPPEPLAPPAVPTGIAPSTVVMGA
jgi:hypothetical protein